MDTYAEKLKDPRWQRRRLEILERDGWSCAVCRSTTKNLQIHHNWYLKAMEPWMYSEKQLCTLCEDCHEKASQMQDELKRVLSEMVPAQQAAILHRSKIYIDEERAFHGISISANREDSEPHRLVRLRRFVEIMKTINRESLASLLAAHDHKGTLELTWSPFSLESGFHSAEQAWMSLGETEVKHFYSDEVPRG